MDKLRMAHQVLGGSVPFYDEALFYRVHMLDVVDAIKYAIDRRVVGTFNLTHAEVPPAMQPYFDALCELDGLPPLTYRNELMAPSKPVSVDALLATGFRLTHTEVEAMPAAPDDVAPPSALTEIDRTGREMVTGGARPDHVDPRAGRGDRAPTVTPCSRCPRVGGPLDGQRIGEFRVFTRADGIRVVYSALVDRRVRHGHPPGLCVHPAPTAPIPHLFLDTRDLAEHRRHVPLRARPGAARRPRREPRLHRGGVRPDRRGCVPRRSGAAGRDAGAVARSAAVVASARPGWSRRSSLPDDLRELSARRRRRTSTNG